MRIKGVSLNEFRDIVDSVSDTSYDGNVIVHQDARDTSTTRGVSCQARLATRDSRAYGSRRSWSGRHMPVASWEAYRDVLRELFARYPDAVVTTALATYRGRDDFEEKYPGTAYRNVGSLASPVTMPQLSV